MELTVDQTLQQGVAAHKEGKLQDAERLYRAILQSQPNHPDANHNLGVIAVSVNKAGAALPLFKTALEANPKIEQFWLSYIDALIKENQFETVKKVLAEGRKVGLVGEKVDALERQLSASVVNLENIESNSDELTPAIKLREAGKYQEAQEWLQKFTESQSNHAEAFSLLCHVLLLHKKDVEAERALLTATSINSELASIYRNQARLLLNQSKPEDALKKAQIGYERSVNDPESWLVLAVCLNANQRSQEALDLTEKILQSNPNYAEAHVTRALIRLHSNDIIGAIADADRAVLLKPHLTRIWVLLGSMHHKNKNRDEAIKAMEKAIELEPTDANYMSDLGEIFRQDSRISEAISILEKATKLEPKNISVLINLGTAFQQNEDIDKAKAAYEKALAINPKSAEISNNLGAIAKDAGDFVSALQYFENALEVKPDVAEAHSNLGVTLKELGRLDEAEASYTQAIALKPDYAEAHSNLGNTLKELGRLDEAEASCRQAIALKPDFAEAHSNLGNTLKELGRLDEAVGSYSQAIALKPDFSEAYVNLGIAIKNVKFNSSNPELYSPLTQLLTSGNFTRARDVAGSILSLLKYDNQIKDLLLEKNFPVSLNEATSIIGSLDKLPLLHHLMRVCPLPELQFEELFVAMRSFILKNLDKMEVSSELIYFLSTLSMHCFTNEYVYIESDEETHLIGELQAKILQTVAQSEQPEAIKILCLASYRPLHQYDWCQKLESLDSLEEVKKRLIEEPLLEKMIAKDIPVLEEISDDVSLKVREQYEENPYPRWVKIGVPKKAKPIAAVCDELKLQLHSENIKNVTAPFILIAGCGTGQHSIGTASRFSNCHVTAVDLSLASLAYAKRKTNELGLGNLEYLQADILHLHQMGKEFDIIESAGTLVCMDEPMAGWRVLVDLLKPGGLMRIGLYSELARQHIVEVRKKIASLGLGTSATEIRNFRELSRESEIRDVKQLSTFSDFFSLSEFRDLVFHVQEHRFTLPQIKNCLDELGLKFCGFEVEGIDTRFRELHGNEADIYDLELWHQYEERNPRTFAGMYQFWCQKIV